MNRKWYFPAAAAMILAGSGILAVQCLVFFVSSNHAAPMLPPAGQTLQPERSSFTVAVFSDFTSRINSVEKVGNAISGSNAEFALCLGDMTRKSISPDFLYVVNALRKSIAPPVYAVPGNWDQPDSGDWGTYRAHFGQDYYFFSYGDTLFIGLNTAEGFLPEEQQTFLKQTLERERAHFSRCVIFCHIPPKDPREDGDHAMDSESAKMLGEIIRPHRVNLILCGHIHRFTESVFEGIPLVITPSSGQVIRDPDNQMYGYLLLDFAEDGSIKVRRVDVTKETGFEELSYFFHVSLCRIGWFAGATASVAGGLCILLWRICLFRRFRRIGGEQG